MSNNKFSKIIDFPTNDAFTIRGLRCCQFGSSEIISDQGRIELRGDNIYRMITERGIIDFSVPNTQDERQLADKMKQYPYNLTCISGGKQKERNEFFLHIAFFYRAERKPKLNIVLSEKVKRVLIEKHYARENTLESDVQANFQLTDGVSSCYAVTIRKYKSNAEDNFSPASSQIQDDNREGDSKDNLDTSQDKLPEDDSENELKISQEQKTIFLYGKDYILRVKLVGESENSFFYSDSIDTRIHYIPPMALFIGDLAFKDEERFATESIKKELDLTEGYMDVWEKYTSIEGNFILEKARKVGLIQFQYVSYVSEGFLVYPKNLSDEQRELLSDGDELLVSEKVPEYISNEDMTWDEFKTWLEAITSLEISNGKKTKKKASVLKLKLVKKDGSWILTSRDNQSFPSGYVSLNLEGDMRQIMRRESAQERIANCEASNPALGLLIEGKKPNEILETKKQVPIDPISVFVKEKLFANREPRERQKEAISIALNTPDIALIQGPPGTGKTTVIVAIIERLNELSDKRQGNQGQVLVTSFQHDAVRNLIDRLHINSLPTHKYGHQGSDDLSQEQAVEHWRLNLVERLKERNLEIQQTSEQQELFFLHNAYLISPSEANAIRFLEYAKKLNTDNDLATEIDRLEAKLTVHKSVEENQLLTKIRRIRTTKQGFLDDGPETADYVLMELEGILSTDRPEHKEILDVLEKAASYDGDDVDENFLAKLSDVRKNLISSCTPKPAYRISQPDSAVLEVFNRLQATLRRPQNEISEILYDLLNELETNTVYAENVIGSYSFAYAATAQQSEGKDIKRVKGIKENEHPEYDTVIIDEAARVNPGDLMIPMTQAKRRIILVGDHRQLPHIYDEEIFESMRDDGNEIGKDIVTKSMFEYIKEKLQELERIDHIPRTITLDAQYRMHPELGELVNRLFYAPHNEGFESPLGEEHFRQGLSLKPYMWIDIPHRLGKEQRKGVSRLRECEADCIISYIQTYTSSPEGRDLTYGVITFYRAQKDMICDKLRRAGLLEKVRVGSVDAFQGMEFDVIFLSVVRTHGGNPIFDEMRFGIDISDMDKNENEYSEWLAYKEEIGMHYYGRLVSENLLCVALSRQKRLLIAVGDSEIFHKGKWGELASKCVPAMRDFYEMCEKEGMVIHGNA
ncbi:DEAD/DEAH box helicase [Succinimonas sp.]|uniref:DEAD/DEAH box helicase n=1 Tax=Succinimonas sp. TaxID=1936151 RepID=UPI00386CD873